MAWMIGDGRNGGGEDDGEDEGTWTERGDSQYSKSVGPATHTVT